MMLRVPLTHREAEVARAIARGLGYRRTGRELGISARTAESYVKRIAQKISGDEELAPLRRVQAWAAEHKPV